MAKPHCHDAVLSDLYARKNTLTEAEWQQFYRVVSAVLMRSRPQALATLEARGFSVQDLIADFFAQKIYANEGTRLDHAGALKVWYAHFLMDVLRREAKKDADHLSFDTPMDDEEEKGITMIDRHPAPPAANTRFEALREARIDPQAVAQAAWTFLDTQPEWVGLYLVFHVCPDGENAVPLYRLAEQHQIASYHYKAEKLGINWDVKKAAKKNSRFENTLLGQWLVGLGLLIDVDHLAPMEDALKILCHEALLRGTQKKESTA